MAPGASVAPHVWSLTGNSDELVFVSDNPVAAAAPLLVNVIDCWALDVPAATVPKPRELGVAESEAVANAVPVPDSAMTIERPPPVMVYVALAFVGAVGRYVNTTVQLAPALSVVPLHVPERLKFAGAAG